MFNRKLVNRLIAISLIAPLPALADTANVSIYGVANVSIDSINTGTSAAGVQGSNLIKASSNATRLGLKGSEDVANGWSANWQIETLIALDNSSNSCAATTIPATTIPAHAAGAAQTTQTIPAVTIPACSANTGIFATRNSFAGLSSKNYGSVLVGRYDTPYKISTRKLDNFSDSIADNRSLFGTVASTSASTAFDGRQPDVIAYTSPLIAGFSAAVAWANLAETATTATANKATAASFAAMYESTTLTASLAYEVHMLNTLRIGGTEAAWRAGLGYTLNDFSVGAAYESTTDTLGKAISLTTCSALAEGANCFGHSASYLTAKYNFGSDALKIAYTKVGALAAVASTGANQFSLGYDHRLTKRSTLFAVYTKLTNDTKANYGLGNVAFSSGATASIGAGAAPSALSFGLKNVF